MERWIECLGEAFEGPLLICDGNNRPIWCNSHWQAMVGGCDGNCGSTWRNLATHDEDLRRWDEVMTGMGANEGLRVPRRTLVRMLLPHTGDEQWCTYTRTPALAADGSHLGWIDTLARATPEHPHSVWQEHDVLSAAQAISHVGAWDWDIATGALWWSDEVYRIFGLQPVQMVPNYESFMAAVHEDDRDDVAAHLNRALAAQEPYDVRHRVIRPDGSMRFVRERGTLSFDAAGEPVRMVGTVADVTEETRLDIAREGAMEALEASEARYRLLAENASDVVWQLDDGGRIAWVSESVRAVLGYAPEEMLGRQALDFVHADDVARARALARSAAADHEPEEFRMSTADGRTRWVSSQLHPVTTESGHMLVGSLRDVDGLVQARAQLENTLGHDLLTGLAVRDVTLGRIAMYLSRLGKADRRVGVLCIRVDSLAAINSAYSHQVGDRVVGEVASAVVATVGDADLVGRGTGNELHVVVPSLDSAVEAGELAERIRCRIADLTIDAGDAVINPTASIGIVAGHRGEDPENLLAAAHIAASKAKHSGQNRYEFLDSAVASEAHQRLAMQANMRAGATRGEFVPWFQPIARLNDGAICGHEALMRWITSDGRVQDAWRFIPVAEASGIIADLDLVVMRAAVLAMADDSDDLTMALNVSAASIRGNTYAAELRRAVAEYGVSAERIHLEVTETALLDLTDEVRATVGTLADEGFSWYVDDFGTGYSSVAHLRDLPITGLKLDRSFTVGVGEGDPTCVRLADGLVGLANGLGLDTVAEGIETDDVRLLLHQQGWQHGQGWLFGRPEAERKT